MAPPPPPVRPHYRPCGIPWRVLGIVMCVAASGAQFMLSPGSHDLVLTFGSSLGRLGGARFGGGSEPDGGKKLPASSRATTSSSGSVGAAPVYTAECPAPRVGPAFDAKAAVQHYLSLPWTMRRKGARIPSPPQRPNDQDAKNVTCFASPYVEGGSAANDPCGLDSYIYYPTAPASLTTLAPDWSQRKADRCAAAKRNIVMQPLSRRALNARENASTEVVDAEGEEKKKTVDKPFIPVKDISCGPEQLCYYPKPLPSTPGAGGFSEAVNTELGVEIGAYLPFFHYEASVGELAMSQSNQDSSAFYFWSANHCEWDISVQRTANGIGGRTPWPYSGSHFGFVNAHVNRDTYPKERFVHPPWGPHYCGWGLFPFLGQRFAFIHNKRKLVEFMGRMINTMWPPTLIALYDLLKDNYVVVYQRPTSGLFKSEQDGFSDAVDDITALEEHAAKVGGVLYVMPRLLQAFTAEAAAQGYSSEDVSLNEVQMTIIAEADVHISVQGGPAYMSMLWGKDKSALLVQRKSPELPYEAHKWFDLLSGMRVETTYSEKDLIARTRDLYYTPHLSPEARAAAEAAFHGLETDAHRVAATRLREKCFALTTHSGGGPSRFEVCLFRSAAQVVMSTEEVYMLGYWEDEGSFVPGVAVGSDPTRDVPAGLNFKGGAECEGAKGTFRSSTVFFSCNATRLVPEPVMDAAGEPSMCYYHINVTLPHDLCFGGEPLEGGGAPGMGLGSGGDGTPIVLT